jgi:glutathione S-transferase
MIIHGSSLSPFVRKVMVVIAEKGLTAENLPVPPGPKSPEFLAISPFGKIPGFTDGDFQLCDSSAIVHYLDAKYPAAPVLPSEPQALGRVVWFDEFADTIMFASAAPIFFNRVVAPLMGIPADVAAADKAEAEALPPVLDYLETVAEPGRFLVGDVLTLADIAVVSPLVNLDHAGVVIDAAKYPKLTAYAATILARPSFTAMVAKDRKFLKR